MRYFRRTAVLHQRQDPHGPNEFPEGTIKTFGALPDFNGNDYWEEVIVTPRPKPQRYKKRIAIFRGFDNYLVARTEEQEVINPYGESCRVTDWVEVEFTERA